MQIHYYVDPVRDIVMLLFGVGAILLNYILAFRPESFERHLADWYKRGDFYDSEVMHKRHQRLRAGSILGFALGGFFIVFSLFDLLLFAFSR